MPVSTPVERKDYKQMIQQASAPSAPLPIAVTNATGVLGLNDLTSSTTGMNQAVKLVFTITITGTASPNRFAWGVEGPSISSGASNVAITGSAQTLAYGVIVTFGATTGHTNGDAWVITVTPTAKEYWDSSGVKNVKWSNGVVVVVMSGAGGASFDPTVPGTLGATTPGIIHTTSAVFHGATSGTATVNPPAIAGTQIYTLPTGYPGVSGYALTATTGGVMSWSAVTPSAPLALTGTSDVVQFKVKAFAGQATDILQALDSSNNEILTLQGDGKFGIGEPSPASRLCIYDASETATLAQIYRDDQAAPVASTTDFSAPYLKIGRFEYGLNYMYALSFGYQSVTTGFAAIGAQMTTTSGQGAGDLVFATRSATSGQPTEKMRIAGAGTATFVGQIASTLATGTSPFSVASTTNVANLNASSLNGATFAAPGAIGGTTASTVRTSGLLSVEAVNTSSQAAKPTIATAGTSATVTNGSTDECGEIAIVGTAFSGDTTVTFNLAHSAAPKSVVLTASDAAGVSVSPYVKSVSATTFVVTVAALTGTASYYYKVSF